MEMKLHIRRILFCILGSLILTATVMLLRDLYALWARESPLVTKTGYTVLP